MKPSRISPKLSIRTCTRSAHLPRFDGRRGWWWVSRTGHHRVAGLQALVHRRRSGVSLPDWPRVASKASAQVPSSIAAWMVSVMNWQNSVSPSL